jgi:hypothetical protein
MYLKSKLKRYQYYPSSDDDGVSISSSWLHLDAIVVAVILTLQFLQEEQASNVISRPKCKDDDYFETEVWRSLVYVYRSEAYSIPSAGREESPGLSVRATSQRLVAEPDPECSQHSTATFKAGILSSAGQADGPGGLTKEEQCGLQRSALQGKAASSSQGKAASSEVHRRRALRR